MTSKVDISHIRRGGIAVLLWVMLPIGTTFAAGPPVPELIDEMPSGVDDSFGEDLDLGPAIVAPQKVAPLAANPKTVSLAASTERRPATTPQSPREPAVAPGPSQPRVQVRRRALVIGIDGLRPDALMLAKTPNLGRLAVEGAVNYDARAAEMTLSGPGWTSLLTGVQLSKHRVADNRFRHHALDEWPTVFDRLQQARPHATTASFVAWGPLHTHLIGDDDVDRRFHHKHDHRVTRAAAATLAEGDPTLTFVHLDGVDRAGHRHGYSVRSHKYMRAIHRADELVGQLLDAIDARDTRGSEEWLIIVTTDHGGTGKGHRANTATDQRIFFIAHGPTVRPGTLHGTPTLADVTPTVLSHLGIAPRPNWNLDGRVIGLDPATTARHASIGPRQ